MQNYGENDKNNNNSEHVASVIVDKEKMYDLTWRCSVLNDLKDAGIAGRMFNFMQNILKSRSFKVKVVEIPSHTKSQSEGILPRKCIKAFIFMH